MENLRPEQGFSQLSREAFDRICNQDMTPQEVYTYLEHDIDLRTFPQILAALCPGRDVKAELIEGLVRLDPAANRDSVAHSVRDWLSGKYEPAGREDLLRICFALKMSEETAGAFLSETADGGFHLRDPHELVYAYCLRMGRDHAAAAALEASLRPLPPEGDRKAEKFVMTRSVAELFASVHDDRSFIAFYNDNFDKFGTLHNTAYVIFKRFYDALAKPMADQIDNDSHYTVDEVVSNYLRMGLPMDKRVSAYPVMLRTIRKYWPNTTSITRMLSRKESVTRRALLLMYLVTEGISDDDDYDCLSEEDEKEDLTEKELFEEQFWRVNTMLDDCGMSPLDPRRIFDWLVLYSLRSNDENSMSDRMRSLLDSFFDLTEGS